MTTANPLYPTLEGVAHTNPSTLHMDGTSPVVVKVQATNDDLRAIHRKRVRLVVDEGAVPEPEIDKLRKALQAGLRCIEHLEGQQAMPDDSYLPLKQQVQEALGG